ncbi:MAG: aminoglycoside phosphotransferase [Alphaproteobacteria bacterium]|nr:aminoglycoside phosphotransferase [Alphaproteobacteria bacterium]
MTRTDAITEFLQKNGYGDAQLSPLAGDASFRRYIRLTRAGKSFMLMDAPPEKEDVRPYVAIAEYLCAKGYSAPRILARDVAAGFLLLEDLADDTFSTVLRSDITREEGLYEAAMDVLAAWHGTLANPEKLPLPLYVEALLMREVALLSDWYLPKVFGAEKAKALGAEYLAIWQKILRENALATDQFVHRDYHVDNLMWLAERQGNACVGLLDFQDGVYGDAAYDVVSLLKDARRDVAPALAQKMFLRYVEKTGVDAVDFTRRYALLGAQRNCKIIGIFVRLCVRDGKPNYLNFLPRVWAHLANDVQHPALAELKIWLDKNVPASARGANA